jgi:hypothetical protein
MKDKDMGNRACASSGSPDASDANPAAARNQMAHTPGPWKVNVTSVHTWIQDGTSYAVARICKTSKEADGNARLIAAAPELLQMLEFVHLGLEAGHVTAVMTMTYDPDAESIPLVSLEEAIAALLAKARGQ